MRLNAVAMGTTMCRKQRYAQRELKSRMVESGVAAQPREVNFGKWARFFSEPSFWVALFDLQLLSLVWVSKCYAVDLHSPRYAEDVHAQNAELDCGCTAVPLSSSSRVSRILAAIRDFPMAAASGIGTALPICL